jgi:hypothetical protein
MLPDRRLRYRAHHTPRDDRHTPRELTVFLQR